MASGKYDGSVRINTEIDTKGINKGVKAINNELETVDNSAVKVNKSFDNISSTIRRIASITALVKLGKDAISLASDLQETQNVVDVAFGNMSYKMEEFSKTCIDSYGISELTAKKIGSSFAAMASGMNFSKESASDMAIELTKLSADMASFYNVSNDEAKTALASIFTGETETLKRYGILITEVNLQEYARQQGITKSISKMTQQEKTMLRYNYVMNATKQAQGDFARTSSSWANQTRVLSERFKQLLTILGNGLIAVLTPAVRMLNILMSYLISFANTLGTVLSDLFGIDMSKLSASSGATFDTVATDADSASDAISGIGDAVEDTAKKINKSISAYDELKVIDKQDASDSSTGGTSGIGSIGAAGGLGVDSGELDKSESAVGATSKRIKKLLDSLRNYCKKNFGLGLLLAFNGLKTNIKNLRNIFENIWGDLSKLGKPIKNYFLNDFTPWLQAYIVYAGTVLNGLFDTFNLVFQSIWDTVLFPCLQTWITVALPLMTQFSTQMCKTMTTLFLEIKRVFDKVWTEGIIPILGMLVTMWQGNWSTMKSVWDKYGVEIFNNIRTAIEKTGDLVIKLWDSFIKPVIDKVIAVLLELWQNHFQPLLKNLMEFFSELSLLALEFYNNFIAPIVGWLIDTFGPVFATIFGAVAEAVGGSLGTAIDWISDLIKIGKDVITFFRDVFKGDWSAVWTDIKNILGDVWILIADVVKAPINLILGFINKLISATQDAINFIISGVNSLNFDIPDWLPDWAGGGKTIGFDDIDKVHFDTIPYLATGAVLPANNPFLAVVGDQTRGTNIEAPAELIKQMAKEAIAESGGQVGDVSVYVYLEGEARGLLKVIKTEVKREKKTHPGKDAFA